MADRDSSAPAEDPSPDGFVGQLGRQQSTLSDFLSSIEDHARLMDASAEDVHQIAVGIGKVVKQGVFGPHGALDLASFRDAYDAFERARADENDIYDVYTDDLQRQRTRQGMNLGVAESDADMFVVVRRRREYISALTALRAQVSAILDLLHAPDISAE